MAGKILLVTRTDATVGPLLFVLLREEVGRAGFEGRVRVDTAGVPGEVGERVDPDLVREVRNLLGNHAAVTLRRYRPKPLGDRLLRQQDLVLSLDDASHAAVTEGVEAIHPVMRPTVKRMDDYPLWEVGDLPEDPESWLPWVERLQAALRDCFRLILADAGP